MDLPWINLKGLSRRGAIQTTTLKRKKIGCCPCRIGKSLDKASNMRMQAYAPHALVCTYQYHVLAMYSNQNETHPGPTGRTASAVRAHTTLCLLLYTMANMDTLKGLLMYNICSFRVFNSS
eukprot:5692851-Pleurochrysis_carterae.AAC.4